MERIRQEQGIDYSLGQSNIDHSNGIHFGVISQGSILQAWCESNEPDFGSPTCPKCGEEAKEFNPDDSHDGWECDWYEGEADWQCENCRFLFMSEAAFGDEAIGWYVDDGEYKATDCLDSDVMVTKSPYYTFTQFCLPCVPGAGNLNVPMAPPMGVKTYCFGHDWFDDGCAPYPIFSIDTGQIVEAPKVEELKLQEWDKALNNF